MATEYTVITPTRHRFGDNKGDRDQFSVDQQAHFDGPSADFEFSCPNVDSSQQALLQFQHRGSTQQVGFPTTDPEGQNLAAITREHPVTINGRELFGGVPASPFTGRMPVWSTRVLIIHPDVLRETNLVKFQSIHEIFGNLDDFTIDNLVVLYKTRRSGTTSPGLSQ